MTVSQRRTGRERLARLAALLLLSGCGSSATGYLPGTGWDAAVEVGPDTRAGFDGDTVAPGDGDDLGSDDVVIDATAVACQPGARVCQGGVVVECAASGDAYVEVENCGAKAAPCVAGACKEAADCAVIRTISEPRVDTPLPGTIVVTFTVSTCGTATEQPQPLTGLTTDQFVIKEDGKPVSATESSQQLVDRSLEAFVTIVMDNSPSVAETGALADAVTAAKSYAQAVMTGASAGHLVSVQVAFFSKALEIKQPFTTDVGAVLAALDLLSAGGGSSTTNLYGATIDAINSTQQAQQARKTAMKGGVNTIGQVVLFTDGSDQAAKYTFDEALAAVNGTPDDVLMIAFAGDAANEVDPTVIKALGKSGWAIADKAVDLMTEFAELAERTSQLQQRVYMLGYCSPKLKGKHELTIELAGIKTQESVGVSFYADSFDVTGPTCSAKAFASACDDKDCGGLLCGGCSGQGLCNDALQCVCADDHFALPTCMTCGSKFAGPGCKACADPKFTGPECDQCAGQWSGAGCAQCTPVCQGNKCGDDGCGGSCGSCEAGKQCKSGACVCAPDCAGKTCGSDGCGGTCGPCGADQFCSAAGQCAACTCAGKECGVNACGKSCGTCPGAAPYCVDQACSTLACTPGCDGKQCGCVGGQVCAGGACCKPSCAGKQCGSDGCGGTCGNCPGGLPCEANGQCCKPSCLGKECGDDGCGGSCAACPGAAPYCQKHSCVASCGAAPACTTGSIGAGDVCVYTPVAGGTGCDLDGSQCTTDACQAGLCTKGPAVTCDDQNACTQDSCDPASGQCKHLATAGAACDADGSKCTVGDVCQADVCTKGSAVACDDKNGCTQDTCEAATGLCKHTALANGSKCDDGSPCTLDDACQATVCQKGPATDCDDGNVCTQDFCELATGQCKHASVGNGVGCDADASKCTTDFCQTGVCTAGQTVDCDDKNACTQDSCAAATGCKQVAVGDGSPCDDGSKCTLNDTCQAGSCTKGPALGCDDQNVCTQDACDPATGQCKYGAANGVTCEADGNKCTADACQSGGCVKGAAVSCDDKSTCTQDSCETATGCKHLAVGNGTPCEDGSKCTLNDKCQTGVCTKGASVVCDDKNVCTQDSCEASTGQCKAVAADGVLCDADGNKCTQNDACQSGACVKGAPAVCNDQNVCTVDSCDTTTGQCKHAAVGNGATCEDGDGCTVTDACKAGVCAGAPKNCGTDKCVAGACVNVVALIPAGAFSMGWVPTDSISYPNEKPQHTVTLDAYAIDIGEVTVAKYKACVDAGKCTAPNNSSAYANWGKAGREQHPVNGVTWPQADAYCKWADPKGRLPTEAEWEKAARGGLQGMKYPWGNTAPDCAPGLPNSAVFSVVYPGCGLSSTWAVGTGSSKNGYGLYDMAGNASEWVSDWYGSGYYGTSPASNPQGPASGSARVVRGGSFAHDGDISLRVSYRSNYTPASVVDALGFRCARSSP